MGESNQARGVYEAILEIDPNNTRARLGLAASSKQSNNDILFLNSLKPVFEDPNTKIDLKIGRILPLIQKVADTGDRQLALARHHGRPGARGGLLGVPRLMSSGVRGLPAPVGAARPSA